MIIITLKKKKKKFPDSRKIFLIQYEITDRDLNDFNKSQSKLEITF